MRKGLVIAVAIIFMAACLTETSFAANNMIKKLGRGIANVGTCPLEVFKGISDANDEDGFCAAITWGVLQGICKTVLRAGVGVYEIVTFPIPMPKDYDPILTDPEFFLSED
ncbi:MAG: exosortase system-associated protein, TIGR04073 family [Candidatus Omnitrophota bacterium]